MTAWAPNPDWTKPLERELCGYVSDRFIPCAHEIPCPIHDPKAGASPLPFDGAPADRPRTSQFDPWEAA